MKKVNFGSTGKQVPAIVMGCMRMKELTVKEAAKLVDAAMAEGVDFLDPEHPPGTLPNHENIRGKDYYK